MTETPHFSQNCVFQPWLKYGLSAPNTYCVYLRSYLIIYWNASFQGPFQQPWMCLFQECWNTLWNYIFKLPFQGCLMCIIQLYFFLVLKYILKVTFSYYISSKINYILSACLSGMLICKLKVLVSACLSATSETSQKPGCLHQSVSAYYGLVL